MDDSARAAFLEQPLTAVLSTLNRDGSIHAVPVWYWYAEGKLFIITGRGSQKHRNVVRLHGRRSASTSATEACTTSRPKAA